MSVPDSPKWWHDSLIDWMLLHPDASLRDAARHFNVSENYISLLRNSDMFKLRFDHRREQLNGAITQIVAERTTQDRVRQLADTTLDLLNERIIKERDSIALDGVRETADMALKALGFAPARVGVQVNTNSAQVAVVSREDLARARSIMAARISDLPPEPSEEELADASTRAAAAL